MSKKFSNDVLAPLRARVQQLQSQAEREREAALQRWTQSEKPVLKEHAAGLKQTMQLLAKEEAALKQRVESLSTSTVRNHPGTSTGFNVIRARVDAFGRPLSTEALHAEKDRLKRHLAKMDVEIAAAKAEITQHRRTEEEEIWETKLVALQVCLLSTTKRWLNIGVRTRTYTHINLCFSLVTPFYDAGYQTRVRKRDQYHRSRTPRP